MFLFYTLMCRNYLEIDKKAKGVLLEVNYDFTEICPPVQNLEIVFLTTEEDVNWKSRGLQCCWKFLYFNLSPKTAESESPGGPVLLEEFIWFGNPKVCDVIDSNSYQT